MVNHCISCGCVLNRPGNPRSVDCGGDCRYCVARCGDPDEIKALHESGDHELCDHDNMDAYV